MRRLLILLALIAIAVPGLAHAQLGTRADQYHAAGALSPSDQLIVVRPGVPLTLAPLSSVWSGVPALNSICGPNQWFSGISGGSPLCTSPTSSDITSSLGYTPFNPANNLSDVPSPPAARASLGVPAHTASAASLGALATSAAASGIWRDSYASGSSASPLFFQPSGSACPLNSGAGDNGSQVPSADAKCWLAQPGPFPSIAQWGPDASGVADATANVSNAVNYSAANANPIVMAGGAYLFGSQPTINPLAVILMTGLPTFAGAGSPYGASATLNDNNPSGDASGQNIITLASTSSLQTGMVVTAQEITGNGATGSQCIPNATTIQVVSSTNIALYSNATTTPVNIACAAGIAYQQPLYFDLAQPIIRMGPYYLEVDRVSNPSDLLNLHGNGPSANGTAVYIQTSINTANNSGDVSVPFIMRSTFRGDSALDYAEGTALPLGSLGGLSLFSLVGQKFGDGGLFGFSTTIALNGGAAQGYQAGSVDEAVVKCAQASLTAICNIKTHENVITNETTGTATPTEEEAYVARLAQYSAFNLFPAGAAFIASSVIGPAVGGVTPGAPDVLTIAGFSGNGDYRYGFNAATIAGATGATHFTSGEWARAFNGDSIASVTYGIGGVKAILPGVGQAGTGCPAGIKALSFSGGGGTGAAASALVSPNGAVMALGNIVPGTGYTSAPTVTLSGCGTAPTFVAYLEQDQDVVGTLGPGTGGSNGRLLLTGGDANASVAITGQNGTGGFGANIVLFDLPPGGVPLTEFFGTVELAGTMSAASGNRFLSIGGTITDTTGTGTVGTQAPFFIGGQTLAASSAVTYTNASTVFITGAPVAGTNVTITNPYAFRIGAGNSIMPTLILAGATPTVAASQVGFGNTLVAAGTGTCPSGTVGGQTVAGCNQINVAGTAHVVPYF